MYKVTLKAEYVHKGDEAAIMIDAAGVTVNDGSLLFYRKSAPNEIEKIIPSGVWALLEIGQDSRGLLHEEEANRQAKEAFERAREKDKSPGIEDAIQE